MVVEVSDKKLIRMRLARAHRRADPGATFLIDHVIADMSDRLTAIERRFTVAVAHGGQTDALADGLVASAKVDRVIRLEQTELALKGSRYAKLIGDEEALPLGPASIDLFVSTLALQWTNDLPGALFQIRSALKPDGLFLGALAAGDTLTELRTALTLAESETRGGASPRVIPTADVRDLGGLLQRAGFALPVADRDVVTVRYDSAFDLFQELRVMGATNTLAARDRRPLARGFFLRAAEIYAERFSDPDGRVRATFDIVSLSGWSPHESQQQPARRGSGQVSLAAALQDKTREE
jgi:SAM-dependent methyltransferase